MSEKMDEAKINYCKKLIDSINCIRTDISNNGFDIDFNYMLFQCITQNLDDSQYMLNKLIQKLSTNLNNNPN